MNLLQLVRRGLGIVERGSEERSVENPAVPISGANVAEMLNIGVGKSPAGVTVTHEKALGLTAFWAGVRSISQAVAGMPCEVYERTKTGRMLAGAHPAHRLVYVRPNPLMTPFTFKELRIAHLLSWGNAYAEIERDGAGRPIALWPLLPDRTGAELRDGEKVYWTHVNGTKVWLAGDRVLHTPGLGFDGIRGYNVIKMHRDSLGLSVAANQYGAEFFGNSGKVSGMLVHPATPNEEERKKLRESWNQMHSGLNSAQRTAIMWGGMKYEQLSLPPEEAQFLQTRETQIEEVARILNINPILLQHFTKATTWGSGVAQFLVAFGKFTIAPWVERDEDVMNWDLFADSERGKFYVKYNMNSLLRGDAETQAKVLEIKRRNGVINADEWRALDEENPLPDGMGKAYFMPLNMAPVQLLINPPEPPAAPDPAPEPAAKDPPATNSRSREDRQRRSLAMRQRLQEAHLAAFEDGARRFVKRDAEAVKRAVKRAFETQDPVGYLTRWIDEFYPTQRIYVAQQMLPLVAALASSIAAEASEEVAAEPPEVDEFARAYTDNLAKRETDSSIGQVKAIVAETPQDELEQSLTTRADEWGEKRPGKVARNEVVRLSSGAARFAWQAAGVMTLVWRASDKACPICQQMNGRKVSSKGYFLIPGESVGELVNEQYLAGPPLHEGCACGISPEF